VVREPGLDLLEQIDRVIEPTGLRTVILSSKAALFDRSGGVVGLFMVRILRCSAALARL
jgi:hypothetical protein